VEGRGGECSVWRGEVVSVVCGGEVVSVVCGGEVVRGGCGGERCAGISVSCEGGER